MEIEDDGEGRGEGREDRGVTLDSYPRRSKIHGPGARASFHILPGLPGMIPTTDNRTHSIILDV